MDFLALLVKVLSVITISNGAFPKELQQQQIPNPQKNRKFTAEASEEIPYPVCDKTVAVAICSAEEKSVDLQNTNNRRVTATAKSRQIEQTLSLIKSILISTKYSDLSEKPNSTCTQFIIVSDRDEYFKEIQDRIFVIEKWDSSFTKYLKLAFALAKYPAEAAWLRNLYRPCASLRILLPTILRHHELIIYLDTDVILLRNFQELWNRFGSFSKRTLSGQILKSCKGREANSGVMLMNLTRMRDVQWTQTNLQIVQKDRKLQKQDDQAIINAYYYQRNRQRLRIILPCYWNFRIGQCNKRVPGFKGQNKYTNGIGLLHGSQLSFTPAGSAQHFRVVYEAFAGAKLTSEFRFSKFVQELRLKLKMVVRPPLQCRSPELIEALMKGPEEILERYNRVMLVSNQTQSS